MLSKSIELAKQVGEEVFLEYRWKIKEAEWNRLIEEGLISKEELESEMWLLQKSLFFKNRLIV